MMDKPLWGRRSSAAVIALSLCVLCGCGSVAPVAAEATSAPASFQPVYTPMPFPVETVAPTEAPLVLDDLRWLFLQISADTTMEELEALISERGLSFTAKDYDKTAYSKTVIYKIAYSYAVAYQIRGEDGDHLTVSFAVTSGGDSLQGAEYVNNEALLCTAVFYSHGLFAEFSDRMEDDYSGYYTHEMLSKNEGVVVRYANGYETSTKMFTCSDGEEALVRVMEKVAQHG